ncbi:MAG: hypothetical protein A2122_02565 [Candidatus Liptonbacteria bacterium GWB1_49_6]|uniref:Major facilitator superfamily (MFS) profile domain-containing protein n=1 Tax=Candidatus Liptonbacteria bacterium GWB1_49_6 TaxID=1798644 RepID=A0A1G2C572_9BACT|nr:MAG: hypothetical protein A2122_02565 [Candidatus Liptonbacteria bacterium GWB1_49_6]
MKLRINIDISVGRVVKYFVLVDLLLLAGWGLVDPIFSVFIVQKIPGAGLVTVGIAAGLYWLIKSFVQLPAAKYLDRTPGEKDDFYLLILGLIIVSFAAFSLTLVGAVWQLYLVQIFKAVGFGFYAASWPAIFSRHLDKEKVSFDWALDSTAAGLAAGASGFVGGVLASIFGFGTVFFIGSIFSLSSAILLLAVPDLVLPQPNRGTPVIKDHTPVNIGQ